MQNFTGAEKEYRAAIAEVETLRIGLKDEEVQTLSILSSLIGFYQDYIEFLMDRGLRVKLCRLPIPATRAL